MLETQTRVQEANFPHGIHMGSHTHTDHDLLPS